MKATWFTYTQFACHFQSYLIISCNSLGVNGTSVPLCTVVKNEVMLNVWASNTL